MNSKSPSKIAFLVPHIGYSGAEVTLEQLLRGLPKDLFEGYLIAPEQQPLIAVAQELGHQVWVHNLPEFHSTSIELGERRIPNPVAILYNLTLVFILALQLNHWLRTNHIQILYAISTFGHLTGALACIGIQCKLIWNVNEILSKRFAGGLGRVIYGCLAKCLVDQVMAPSHAVADSILYVKKPAVIASAVDIEKYAQVQSSTLRSELQLASDVPLVGVIGRLTPWKGQRLFIEAVARLLEQGQTSHFVIVGDTTLGKNDYSTELKNLSKLLQVDGSIFFLGFRKDIPNIMKGLDILVVPSLRPEPFGLVALEAMAASKAVIGSNSGGLADIVVHEQTGLLFKLGNADDLARAIKRLIIEPELQTRYGQAGFERAKQEYTVEHYLSQVIQLLNQLTERTQ